MLLSGIVLLYLAMRGRRIDDHPVCRRCRFDLIGLPPGGNKCSECGADLKRRRAIRIGNRQRRWGWVLLGMLLILGNGIWLSIQSRRIIAENDFTPYKPVWLLLSEARSSADSPRQRKALSRLV